jgi:hypothetical protein
VTTKLDPASLAALGHVDDSGAPCARHAALAGDVLLQLAMVGSRASAFHPDCASKLQGLVMALDELGELSEHGDPQIIRAVEAAMESTKELHALLNLNRALTKPPNKVAVALGELMTKAAQRVGVQLAAVLPPISVAVAAPAMTHALALVLDVAAGTGRGRTIAITAAQHPDAIELTMTTSPAPPSNASELLTIAGFVIARDGGQLWCARGDDRLTVRLPLPV